MAVLFVSHIPNNHLFSWPNNAIALKLNPSEVRWWPPGVLALEVKQSPTQKSENIMLSSSPTSPFDRKKQRHVVSLGSPLTYMNKSTITKPSCWGNSSGREHGRTLWFLFLCKTHSFGLAQRLIDSLQSTILLLLLIFHPV